MATVTSQVNQTNDTNTAAAEAKAAAEQNAAATPTTNTNTPATVKATDTAGASAPTKQSSVATMTGDLQANTAQLKALGLTDAEINSLVVARGVNQDSLNALKGDYVNIADQLKQNGVNMADSMKSSQYDSTDDQAMLQQQKDAAIQQYNNQIDYATNKSVQELQDAQKEADEGYADDRKQNAIDTARAKDDAALYSASRGDNGGIGQAQYNAIMAQAAQAQLEINKAQTKTANETAKQISDLRAQGEYEKADKLLEVTQQYLADLLELKQWAANYNLSVDQINNSLVQWETEYNNAIAQYNAGLDQWQIEYNNSIDQYNASLSQWAAELNNNATEWNSEMVSNLIQQKQTQLANAGEALLEAGVMPSSTQLSAMGMTSSQAQAYIDALYPTTTYYSGGGGSSSSGGTKYVYVNNVSDGETKDPWAAYRTDNTATKTFNTYTGKGTSSITTSGSRRISGQVQ